MEKPKRRKTLYIRDLIRMSILTIADTGERHPTQKAMLFHITRIRRELQGADSSRTVQEETRCTAALYLRQMRTEGLIKRDRKEHDNVAPFTGGVD